MPLLPKPEWLVFVEVFLKHPRDVSSLMPTRAAVAKRIADRIQEQCRQVVVEYGPATGVLSQQILSSGKLERGSSLILIEKSPEFARYLRSTLRDPRVSIFNDSAEHILDILKQCNVSHADYVFSGVPLSLTGFDTADTIVRYTHAALRDGGLFVQYAFRRNIEVLIDRYFDDVRSTVEFLNFPPLTVYEARKH